MSRDKLTNLRGDHSRLEVAQDLEITPQMLGAIERGSRTPSLPLAKKIADYYGAAIEDIFWNMKNTKCVIKRRRNMKKLLVGATLLITVTVVIKKVAEKKITLPKGKFSFENVEDFTALAKLVELKALEFSNALDELNDFKPEFKLLQRHDRS